MNIGYKVGELIYDANIYDGLNTFLSDLQFYKKWLPKNKEAEILELCCGTGRLTIPIAKDGYSICGVDYTPSMLEQAKMKAIEAELVIDFIEADIRMLDLQEKFDLIFIPFNSMNRVLSIFLVAFYALLGAIIYFGLMFKTGMIYDVFGRGNVEKILAKLKIKRRG